MDDSFALETQGNSFKIVVFLVASQLDGICCNKYYF